MKTSSIVMIVIAILLGLFFGNILGGLLGALIVAVVAAAGAYLVMRRYETSGTTDPEIVVEEPGFSHFLFKDTRSAALWLALRIFLGWEWLTAGWHKLQSDDWMVTGNALKGYWTNAVAVPAKGSPPISYDWWRSFIQTLLDNGAYTWFAKLIVFGELLVGLGLIFGALVGVAAFSGALMNISYLLTGSTSSNPVLFTVAILLILAWKVAGWIGIDHYLLPLLGTPWQKGVLLGGKKPPVQAPTRV